MEEYHIEVDGHTITYILVRKKVKNINLRVRSGSAVLVSAGRTVPHDFIEQAVRKKARWILKNQERFAENSDIASNRQYITGEIIDYLGRQYPLLLHRAAAIEKVDFDGAAVSLFVKEGSNPECRKKLLQLWYKQEAKTVFHHSLERMHSLVAGHGIEKPSITIRTMKTRWGSCSWKKQKITLNTELLKATESSIDYVVLHELAHFRHKKHDKSFYNFLSEVMPDWKARKKALKTSI